MRNRASAVLVAVLVLFLAGAGYFAAMLIRHGFSAREDPSWLEEFLARHARKIATPAEARQLTNPYPPAPDGLAAARQHWVAHCAACHAIDGSGDTVVGRNLYPDAPDMRDEPTQSLSDGELYYIINNGVRFTGMPAWGGEHTAEQIWQLVSLIRRLPNLSPEELEAMEQLAAEASAEAPGHHHSPEETQHAD